MQTPSSSSLCSLLCFSQKLWVSKSPTYLLEPLLASGLKEAVRGAQPGRHISAVSASPHKSGMTESQQTLQCKVQRLRRAAVSWLPLWAVLSPKSSIHSSMRGHHPQPRPCACVPSLIPAVGAATTSTRSWNTLAFGSYSHCDSLGLQNSQSIHAPAVQHCQISAPNTPAAKLVQWHHAGTLATALGTLQNVAEWHCNSRPQGILPSRHRQCQDGAGVCPVVLWVRILPTSFCMYRKTPSNSTTQTESVRALGKHLKSNRSPPVSLLEVTVHEHDHMNSFFRLLPAQDDKQQAHSSHFIGQRSSVSMQKSKGRAFPGAICLTSAGVPLWPALHLLS